MISLSNLNFRNIFFCKSDYNKQSRRILSFFKARTGNPKQQIVWHYSGVIRNPLTGSEIVAVEGIEITRCLSSKESSYVQNKTEEPFLFSNNHNASCTVFPSSKIDQQNLQRSYLSRKAFIYLDRQNNSHPVTSYKIRPQSPRRKVNPTKILHELITVGTKAIDIGGTSSNIISNSNSNGNTGKEISSPTTFPDKISKYFQKFTKVSGISINDNNTNIASSSSNSNSNSYNFVKIYAEIEHPGGRKVYADNLRLLEERGGPFPWSPQRLELTSFVVGKRKKNINRWISFSSATDTSGRSQEYYTIRYNPWLWSWSLPAIFQRDRNAAAAAGGGIVMDCKRIGECPPWFAPGRSCTTELRATRYTSLRDVPRERLKLFREQCPDFFTIPLTMKTFQNATDLLYLYRPWYIKLLGTKPFLFLKDSKFGNIVFKRNRNDNRAST